MKKKLLLILAILQLSLFAQEKEYGLNLAYGNYRSSAFDQILRYYNFSQPWLSAPQPLLQHGINASLFYYGKQTGRFRPGGQFRFDYFPSLPANKNIQPSIHPKALTLGFIAGFFPFDSLGPLKNLSFDACANFGVLATSMRLNGEKIQIDPEEETIYKSRTFTYNIELRINYTLLQKTRYSLGLFAGTALWPRAVINDFSETLTGSALPGLEAEGLLFSWHLGIRQTFK